MNLNPLQTYCLDAMGITRYKLNSVEKPYAVFYIACEDSALEQANKALLGNILNALQWPITQVKICAVSQDVIKGVAVSGEETLACVLLFGIKPEESPGNLLFVRLPGLSELHENVALKRKVWNQLKSFVRKD